MSGTTTKEKRKLVRKVAGVCAIFSDGTIRLINVRASYPWVIKAQKNDSDDGEETYTYSVVALMPKDTHEEAKKACVAAINKLQAAAQAGMKGGKPFKYAAAKKFIKNGDAVDDDGERLMGEEAAGMWVVSARERNRPLLRGPNKDPETGKAERLTPAEAQQRGYFYGGCFVDVIIRPWAQDNKYGKRVNAGLTAIQFKKHGEPFGQGRVSEDEIDDSFDASDGDEDSGGWGDDDDM